MIVVLQEGEYKRYQLINQNKVCVEIADFGATLLSIKVPDRNGLVEEVLLGYSHISDHANAKVNPYFGAIVGRYGNRIHKGKFSLNGKTYQLFCNNGNNHLHGGKVGFDRKTWQSSHDGKDVIFQYTSPHLEEGYPGNLNVEVRYSLNDQNELSVHYLAKSDQATIVNLTNHAYFNLSGDIKENILNHQLQLNANKFVAINEESIPTGELMSVDSTPFDFLSEKKVGENIDDEHPQLKNGNGYDHCFVLDSTDELAYGECLKDTASGRSMKFYTTEPGVQFYSGNFLDGSLLDRNQKSMKFRSGLCLETQHYPDSPNQQHFPSVVLEPGEKYRSTTVYQFGID